MKASDVLNIKNCLFHQAKDIKTECVDKEKSIYQVTLPFENAHGTKIQIFAYQRGKSKKIHLTDGGRVIRTVEDSPTAKAFLAKFVKQYSLCVMEDGSIMDLTNRPLGKRLSSLLQMLIAIDGINRSFIIHEGRNGNGVHGT